MALVLTEPARKRLDPFRAEFGRQRRRQQIMERARAHRRQIRQIDPQQLLGDQIGRVVAQIMHALDDRVGGHHQPLPGVALDQCGIVEQSQPARPGERREIAPDALELAVFAFSHGS